MENHIKPVQQYIKLGKPEISYKLLCVVNFEDDVPKA